jgi:Tfp pilus assembly protein PilF
MSLLLDALKTRESSAPSSAESHEEALDGRDALNILTAKMDAGATLTLENPAGEAGLDSAPPVDSAVPLRASTARNATMPHTVAARPSGLPPPSPAAPLPASPARRYAAMLAAAVTVVIIVMVGKSLLSKNSNPVNYPVPAMSPQVAGVQPAAPPTPSTVQVPTRPASQFSGVNAPEIDLREDVLQPAANQAAVGAARKTIRADKSAAEAAATSNPSVPARGSFSVTPSAGMASVDKHIEAGYRALASGNLATAQREYHEALDLDPNNIDALLGTASTAARAGNATLAAAAYSKVLKVEPGNKDATAALSILNRDPTAAEANESRLKVMIAGDNERRPALHAALAGVYAADARWADAAQEYFIALSMDQGDANLAFNLAASLDQNHNAAAALTYYRQALAAATLRPAQIDAHAIEARISQLQARLEVQPATPRAAP